MKNHVCSFVLLCTTLSTYAQSTDTLFQKFQNPPVSAKPIVWWHWVGGNVTKEGITKDLEWMKRIGIGGFHTFDVVIGGGQSIEKKVKYRSPEWFALIKHTAAEADRLGLDMTLVTAAGWSETGGTWVKPHEAMKKLVSNTLQIKGGTKFNGKLPQPPNVNGAIRNLPKHANMFGGDPKETFYADQTVLAYKTPEAELQNLKPQITNNKGEKIISEALLDDDLTTKISVDVPKADAPTYLQYEFSETQTMRSFSIAWGGAGMFPSQIMRPYFLQVSQDGQNFRTFYTQTTAQHDIRALPVRTVSFPEVKGKFFRLVFTTGSTITTVGGPDDAGGFGMPAVAPTRFDLTEAIFSPIAKVNRWEDKANYAPMYAFDNLATPSVSTASVVKTSDIIDLTSKLKPDGTLEWEAPTYNTPSGAGGWTILRMGYSLTGATNAPAAPDATGFEVDKLSKTHLESYMQQWSEPIKQALGDLYGKSLKYFLVDSYEADAQNWTDNMVAEFSSRRGYDPTKYLPILRGVIVESAEVSDRFLWDFRLTIAELLVENHYAALTDIAHKQGIKTYGEVAGISLPIIQDALRNKAAVDIPMAEFGMTQGLGSDETKDWTSPADLETQKPYAGAQDRLNAHQADVREAASAGHIYGKKIVGAESWTGGGYESPEDLKFIGDYWSTQGINQFIIHTSAHQPLDTKAGNTMVGTHFHRNITWAEQAKPFIDYISRNQYLLQEGRFVADIAYFLGEDMPAAVPYWEKLKYEIPNGYDYDFVNTEILNRFKVDNGDLVLPSGMRYKVLVLPDKKTMTLPVLEKIMDLVKNGATIVGTKPEKSPGLVGYPNIDEEIVAKANTLWGAADGKFIYQNTFGKGKVFWNIPLLGILAEKVVKPDLVYTQPNFNTRLSWIHRQTADADYYFILNMRKQAEDIKIQCRITGKKPELWYADKGIRKEVNYKIENGFTTVECRLEAQESVFLVFQKNTNQTEFRVSDARFQNNTALNLSNNWTLEFPNNKQITVENLKSWTEEADTNSQFFSGTATYFKTFDINKKTFQANKDWLLDLGKVKDIAIVSLNGVVLDTLWHAPYQVDMSKAVKIGKNVLTISVTNQWDNRIAGDDRLPKEKKQLSFSGGMRFGHFVTKTSGLLGPVLLKTK